MASFGAPEGLKNKKTGQSVRIVHCFRSPVGGIFRHVRDLCEAQIADGHELGIVCDSTTGGAHEDRYFHEIEPKLALGLIRTPMQRQIGPSDIVNSWRTFRAVKAMRPDILHGHGAKGGVYSRVFGTLMRLSKHPVARLYSPHGGSLHYSVESMQGRIFFTIERLLEHITDHLIFVSDYEKRTYQEKVGIPKCPATLVYNGVRTAEFEPVMNAADATDFLYIGMMRDLKGPDLFLTALKSLESTTGHSLTATLVGDGDDREKYIAQAEALGFADRVRFLPAMPTREAFRLGRLMVVPSRAEAMPYIVLEALAAGKPLIATDVGGIPEVFETNLHLLSKPLASALGQNMLRAISDENAWRKAMPTSDYLKRRFSVEVMAEQIAAIYRATRSTET